MLAGLAQVTRIALAALALSLLVAPAAQAARSEFFGVVQGPPLANVDYEAISATEVKTARFLLPWMLIERSRGERDWRETDRTVGGLAAQGIQAVPFAWGSPSWTRTGGWARPPVNSGPARRAWESFLKAAVSRYGPGGSYWRNEYRQLFGEDAVPLPIRSWQVWNEPNPRQQFAPGATVAQAARLYAELVRISHDAIKPEDRRAKVVTAGFITQLDPHVFEFIDRFYSAPGIKAKFDAVAQHAYAPSIGKVRAAIKGVRRVMAKNGDGATPLWITELGWGSAPADGQGINLGPEGQARMLTRSFRLILGNRSTWNVQRLYWFHWRDPAADSPFGSLCIRCGSAGLVTYDRTPKPALDAFLAFAAETMPPTATIAAGPSGPTNNPRPRFSLASSEAGSTFACRIDSGKFKACASPYTTPRLSQGAHTLSVKAIDAAGNESAVVSRTFRVDTRAPAAPRIESITPASPANSNTPTLSGSAEAGSTVRLYKNGCTGPPIRKLGATQFASRGITVVVNDNTTTGFRATATDAAGNVSPCSPPRTYVEDSLAPETTITAGPSGPTTDPAPTFTFASSEAQSTFRCRFDDRPYGPCSGPGQSHAPAVPLASGPHTFSVKASDRAQNTDPTPASRAFTVVP